MNNAYGPSGARRPIKEIVQRHDDQRDVPSGKIGLDQPDQKARKGQELEDEKHGQGGQLLRLMPAE